MGRPALFWNIGTRSIARSILANDFLRVQPLCRRLFSPANQRVGTYQIDRLGNIEPAHKKRNRANGYNETPRRPGERSIGI